jgi:hypothetical protein
VRSCVVAWCRMSKAAAMCHREGSDKPPRLWSGRSSCLSSPSLSGRHGRRCRSLPAMRERLLVRLPWPFGISPVGRDPMLFQVESSPLPRGCQSDSGLGSRKRAARTKDSDGGGIISILDINQNSKVDTKNRSMNGRARQRRCRIDCPSMV